MNRAWALSAWLLSAAAWAVPPPSLIQVHPDVWVHTSHHTLSNGMVFPGNGLVVRHDGKLTVVDTGWGEDNAHQLLDLLAEQFEEPVSAVLVSHFHDDSAGGASLMASQGIEVLGSEATSALGADVTVIEGLVEGTAHTIGPVELFYPGPAHTQDNLVAWVPHARVLFGGCAVRSPEYPGQGNTADGDVDRWAESIQAVVERYPDVEVVVPGHGQAGDGAFLQHTISVFSIQ